MKKYPLSSKAVKALLVTSLALTPTLGLGLSNLSTHKVEAATTGNVKLNNLISYLDQVSMLHSS